MRFIELKFEREGYCAIGELNYGTVVTDVISHPQSLYMKVDKRGLGQGLSINHSRNHSVLVNLKSGTLREIPGNSQVRVLMEDLKLYPAGDIKEFKKGY